MIASDLMKKAARAAASARLLLNAGDVDGACNRAYYAMFDAAHAALLLVGANADPRDIRKHASLIRLFGQHVVNPGLLPDTLGKALNKVEQVRMLADYTGEEIEPEKAAWAVTQAALFVAAVDEALSPPGATSSASKP